MTAMSSLPVLTFLACSLRSRGANYAELNWTTTIGQPLKALVRPGNVWPP